MQDSADTQGGRIVNAMPFVSAKDPRIPTVKPTAFRFGFDGVTPYDRQDVFPAYNSPVPVANYVDAQLALAERSWRPATPRGSPPSTTCAPARPTSGR
ncbi:MAG: hypothetical protein IPK33_00015 [Gemmatimonadetes bacterium]|nr:hypothetical protein [Gemmatimonadota bacterium]